MQRLTEELLTSALPTVFSDLDVDAVLGSPTPATRHGLVKRALAARELVRLRKGLYTLAEPYRREPLDLFAVAALLYRPSYVSLESALATHGWIPESVPIITSGCFRRRRTFETPVGSFEFRTTPFRDLAGVERIECEGAGAYLLASPLRALCDLAHDRSSVRADLDYLVQSLRVDPVQLDLLRRKSFTALREQLKEGRAQRFLRALQRELGR